MLKNFLPELIKARCASGGDSCKKVFQLAAQRVRYVSVAQLTCSCVSLYLVCRLFTSLGIHSGFFFSLASSASSQEIKTF